VGDPLGSHLRTLRRLLLIPLLLLASDATAVKRGVVKEFQDELAGRTFRLRVDLQGTNYLAVPNIVNHEGFHYRGRQFPVLFKEMEIIYVDRVSNDGNKSMAITLYRNKKEAGQIRGAIPAPPLGPVGQSAETTLGSFARDLSTTVILELRADKSDPDSQRGQIRELLSRVFYYNVEPTHAEREAYILHHRDVPVFKLAETTALPEEMVKEILKRGAEAAAPEDQNEPVEKEKP
jgi:hypothetical protein